MSGKFNGFSQEDINKLSGKPHIKNAKPTVFGIRRLNSENKSSAKSVDTQSKESPKLSVAPLAIIANTNTKNTNNIINNNNDNNNMKDTKTEYDFNLDESMSRSIEDALLFGTIGQKLKNSSSQHANDDDNHLVNNSDASIKSEDNVKLKLNDSSILADPRTNHSNDSPFKGVSLQDFESHRKIIQEQNKQKKDMLYKAIEQHSQKTAAEAKKIEEIKGELNKLDSELAADVAILRKEIEYACVNYANIEKQYNKIEAQFLRAKLDLHNASEKKELLTEHLCTVITHNEDHKAKKLTELMEKVGLSPTGKLDDTLLEDAYIQGEQIDSN